VWLTLFSCLPTYANSWASFILRQHRKRTLFLQGSVETRNRCCGQYMHCFVVCQRRSNKLVHWFVRKKTSQGQARAPERSLNNLTFIDHPFSELCNVTFNCLPFDKVRLSLACFCHQQHKLYASHIYHLDSQNYRYLHTFTRLWITFNNTAHIKLYTHRTRADRATIHSSTKPQHHRTVLRTTSNGYLDTDYPSEYMTQTALCTVSEYRLNVPADIRLQIISGTVFTG